MCKLFQLQDGTYSIDDLADFHEAIGLKAEVNRILSENAARNAKR